MRILLTNHHPFAGSGAGSYTFYLARGLVAAGHEVRCLVVDDQSGPVMGMADPCPVRRVVCRRDGAGTELDFDLPLLVPRGEGTQGFGQLSDAQLTRYRDTLRKALDAEVDAFDPQVIHCQHAWLLAQLALESGVPYVLTAHGEELCVAEDVRYAPLMSEAAENASRLLTSTRALREAFEQRFHDAELQCEVLPPGLELEEERWTTRQRRELLLALGLPEEAGSIVASVGRFAPGQGFTTLLNAAAVYERTDRTLHTVVIGAGPLQHELESQTRHQGLSQVHWLGWRNLEDCRRLYALADLVVVPAHRWPSTWNMLEALAAGTPVIAARSSGSDEIVTAEVGGLVPVADHELLAEMILRAIESDWKSHRGSAARQLVEAEFGAKHWIEEVCDVYRRVLAARFGEGHVT